MGYGTGRRHRILRPLRAQPRMLPKAVRRQTSITDAEAATAKIPDADPLCPLLLHLFPSTLFVFPSLETLFFHRRSTIMRSACNAIIRKQTLDRSIVDCSASRQSQRMCPSHVLALLLETLVPWHRPIVDPESHPQLRSFFFVFNGRCWSCNCRLLIRSRNCGLLLVGWQMTVTRFINWSLGRVVARGSVGSHVLPPKDVERVLTMLFRAFCHHRQKRQTL